MAHHFISQIDHMLNDHGFDKFMFGFGNEGIFLILNKYMYSN